MSAPDVLQSPWIVIPTYNERDNIAKLLSRLLSLPIPNLTVLVVDDNSPDGTADAVRSVQANHPNVHLENRAGKSGLGRAYIHGFRLALHHGASAVVQMDADFSHDPNDVPRLLQALEKADLVLGSRYSQGISVVNWPLRRLLISLAGNRYASLVTGMPFKDATGGFKAWRADTLRDIDFNRVQADGYGFQIVMTYRAWKQKHRIIEVPIIFTERREGKSKMSKHIIWEALWRVWKLRFGG